MLPDIAKQMGLVEMARTYDDEQEFAKDVIKKFGLQRISSTYAVTIACAYAEAHIEMNKVPDFTKPLSRKTGGKKRTIDL